MKVCMGTAVTTVSSGCAALSGQLQRTRASLAAASCACLLAPCCCPWLQEAIEMFIEIAEAHPRFLRKQLPEVVGAMLQVGGRLDRLCRRMRATKTCATLALCVASACPARCRRGLSLAALLPCLQIAESEALDAGVRTLAAEFLVTLCEAREKAPGMMRKLPQVGTSQAARSNMQPSGHCLAFLAGASWRTGARARPGQAGALVWLSLHARRAPWLDDKGRPKPRPHPAPPLPMCNAVCRPAVQVPGGLPAGRGGRPSVACC